MAEVQLKNLKEKHHKIIDYLLTYPEMRTLQPLAEHMNVTRGWLSIIMNSDAFKAELTRRRNIHHETLNAGLSGKILEASGLALDRVTEALKPQDGLTPVDPKFALEAADKLLKKTEFGPTPGSGVNVKIAIQNNLVGKDVLAEAREKMRTISVIASEQEALPAE